MRELIKKVLREQTSDNTIQQIMDGVLSDVKIIYPNFNLTYEISDNNKTVNVFVDSNNNTNGKVFNAIFERIQNLVVQYSPYGNSTLKFDVQVQPTDNFIKNVLGQQYFSNIYDKAKKLGIDIQKYWYDFDGKSSKFLDDEIKRRDGLKSDNFLPELKKFIQEKTDVPLLFDIKIDKGFHDLKINIYPQITFQDFNNCKYSKWESFDSSVFIDKIINEFPFLNRPIFVYTEVIWPREVGNYIVNQNEKIRNKLSATLQKTVSVSIDYGPCINQPIFSVAHPSGKYNQNYLYKVARVIEKEFPNSPPIDVSYDYWKVAKKYQPNDQRYWSKEQLFNYFVEQSKNTFGDLYDYSIDRFQDLDTLTEVYCKQHDRWFEVLPKEHIGGKRCPFDNESKGETMVRVYLEKNNIPFKQYHKLKGCFSEINGRCILLTFDFYLPEQNAVIEYDGEQHYRPVKRFGGEETYKRQVLLDNIKNVFCNNTGINMIRIPYTVKKPKDMKELLDSQLK